MPDGLHCRVGEFRKCHVHDSAKDQYRTDQSHNHAAVRHRLPGDVELRLEFIRHEPVPTSLQNSENTGYLSLCDHHILAGRGIKIESGWTGLRKCDRPVLRRCAGSYRRRLLQRPADLVARMNRASAFGRGAWAGPALIMLAPGFTKPPAKGANVFPPLRPRGTMDSATAVRPATTKQDAPPSSDPATRPVTRQWSGLLYFT